MVRGRLAFVLLVGSGLAALVLGCGLEKDRNEWPGLDWAPRVGVLTERMQSERANNSLVFVQDRVGSRVEAVGHVHRVLPDAVVVFRETDGEFPDLWCAPDSSSRVPRFKGGHRAVLSGKVVDFVPGHGVTRGYLRLRECAFLRVLRQL